MKKSDNVKHITSRCESATEPTRFPLGCLQSFFTCRSLLPSVGSGSAWLILIRPTAQHIFAQHISHEVQCPAPSRLFFTWTTQHPENLSTQIPILASLRDLQTDALNTRTRTWSRSHRKKKRPNCTNGAKHTYPAQREPPTKRRVPLQLRSSAPRTHEPETIARQSASHHCSA